MATQIERRSHTGSRFAGTFGWGAGIGILVVKSLNALLDLSVTVRDQLLVIAICRLRLLQREDVLGAVITNQALRTVSIEALIRWSRSLANVSGSVSPATMASTMASPVTPVMSLMTW